MKVTFSCKNDNLIVYVPKKDLEAEVIGMEKEGAFGGKFVLSNGWELYLDPQNDIPTFPKTYDVKKL